MITKVKMVSVDIHLAEIFCFSFALYAVLIVRMSVTY